MKSVVRALAALLTTAAIAAPSLSAEKAKSPARKSTQIEKVMERRVGEAAAARYLLFLPPGCGKDKKRWPMILFLHGAGERGDNLSAVKKHGPPKLVEKDAKFGFIVVSPQCPRGQWWNSDVLTALLDEVIENHPVDARRVYLTGLSMGGFGTWTLAARHPERFAAIVPICGGGRPGDAARLKDIPTWVFHGGKDGVVPVRKSEEMVAAMKKAGAKEVKLTVYGEAGHDSWSATYANPKLYKWLLEHRRKKPAKPAAKKPATLKTRT